MNILYLSAADFPSEKSHSLSIMRVCQAFADAGHKVTLTGLYPRNGDTSDPTTFYGLKGGFKVIRHKLSRLWHNRYSGFLLLKGIGMAWKTRELIKETQPDIIYSRLTITELLFVPNNLPIVYEMHSLGPLGQGFIRRNAFRLIVKWKNFSRLIVTTNVLADLLQKEFPKNKYPNLDIVIARLSAEEPIAIEATTLATFRAENLKGENFSHHVGYTGYMDTYGLRGTDIIIQTAAHMPHAAFHLVGGEPQIVEHWRNYAQDYNQHGNIFFYGYRNPNEMPYFLNCFDVTLAPLQYRPSERAPIGQNMSPLKLPQYMGYGKAIVASDLPAHRECLRHDETALLVKCDDIDAWENAISSLLNSPEKRSAMAIAGRAAYEADYTPSIRVQRILQGL